MSDPQDRAESLDEEELGEEYPPDAPMGVDEAEVTPAGEWASESFEGRTSRQQPEAEASERPVVQPYVDPSEDVLDEEAQAVADAEIAERDPDADRAPAAAEEAAIHLEEG